MIVVVRSSFGLGQAIAEAVASAFMSLDGAEAKSHTCRGASRSKKPKPGRARAVGDGVPSAGGGLSAVRL